MRVYCKLLTTRDSGVARNFEWGTIESPLTKGIEWVGVSRAPLQKLSFFRVIRETPTVMSLRDGIITIIIIFESS